MAEAVGAELALERVHLSDGEELRLELEPSLAIDGRDHRDRAIERCDRALARRTNANVRASNRAASARNAGSGSDSTTRSRYSSAVCSRPPLTLRRADSAQHRNGPIVGRRLLASPLKEPNRDRRQPKYLEA